MLDFQLIQGAPDRIEFRHLRIHWKELLLVQYVWKVDIETEQGGTPTFNFKLVSLIAYSL
jgi:hypothetical protein